MSLLALPIKNPVVYCGRVIHAACFIQTMYEYTTVVYVSDLLLCLLEQFRLSSAHTNDIQLMIAVYSFLEL